MTNGIEIVQYSNRKYYAPRDKVTGQAAQYVNLTNIATRVLKGEQVKVTHVKGGDITKQTLLSCVSSLDWLDAKQAMTLVQVAHGVQDGAA